jgi:monoamine oxidase
MQEKQAKVGIIGGGLAGIYTAYLLAQHKISFELIEAKSILGGRIYGEETQISDYKMDLGPSWIFPHQQEIQTLVADLGLKLIEQYTAGDAIFQRNSNEPAQQIQGVAPPPMYRIFGGTTKLIDSLANGVNKQNVCLSTIVNSLQFDGQHWHLAMSKNDQASDSGSNDEHSQSDLANQKPTVRSASYECIVIATPPRIVAHLLRGGKTSSDNENAFLSALSSKFEQTPTWMAAQAKFAVTYGQPFWRERGLSGQAFSQVGPLGEIHDASFEDSEGNSVFALFGFVGIPFAHRQHATKEQMKNACLAQLSTIFGANASKYTQTYYKDWGTDNYTATTLDQNQASAHPHIDLTPEQARLQQLKLHLATSEFSAQDAGYMEGAILAAKHTVKSILLSVS